MKGLRRNRGNVTYAAVFAVVFCIFAVLYGLSFRAEAVIGGKGTLTDTANPHHLAKTATHQIKATDETRICVFCHTPHNAITSSSGGGNILNAPLWNHTLTNSTFVTWNTYTPVYNAALSNTLGLHVKPLVQPDGASRLCLSCHDGTISVGNVRSLSADISMVEISGCIEGGYLKSSACGLIGGGPTVLDLRSKHVVSVPMNSALKTASDNDCIPPLGTGTATTHLKYPWDAPANSKVILRPTTATYSGSGVSPPTAPSPPYKTGYGYGVQCSTCHDPHYWVSGTSTPLAEGQKFLVTEFNSLCKAGHIDCP